MGQGVEEVRTDLSGGSEINTPNSVFNRDFSTVTRTHPLRDDKSEIVIVSQCSCLGAVINISSQALFTQLVTPTTQITALTDK